LISLAHVGPGVCDTTGRVRAMLGVVIVVS
jgi:hypothetical protein